ncbi:hypothetical protein Tco_0625364 [Tanacetum coccineum]|uniref:Retrotransposon gag domain-containing protein n=1 Tax=Tanacetum coccineum TaxID=301880 RepID=A0ABQ4WGN5_9ASTR
MGTVAEYHNEFEMIIKRVTRISESLLKSCYISGLKVALQIELLRARPTTLGESFFLARITEARFEAIVHEEKATAKKDQNIKETTDTITSLRSEVASPEVKGSLDANEDTLLSLRSEDSNLSIQEKAVEYVRALNAALLKVVFARPFDIGVDEDEGGEFDDRLDEINLDLSQEFMIGVLESRDVSGGSLVGFLKWVYHEKNCEVFSVTSR